ncbi:hypothetical protein EJ04DRAFT_102870 [Polyplosphaeria fusca]|uniref:Uncharacterized protein n=1 Tax=Polyplosphaeria fusca TaxID=682080 RepID=A0A9P4V5K3_9PLEO|nr:hypothetical protein EJ04DRAFT_102870 [Polyplosphaeria fusca]
MYDVGRETVEPIPGLLARIPGSVLPASLSTKAQQKPKKNQTLVIQESFLSSLLCTNSLPVVSREVGGKKSDGLSPACADLQSDNEVVDRGSGGEQSG